MEQVRSQLPVQVLSLKARAACGERLKKMDVQLCFYMSCASMFSIISVLFMVIHPELSIMQQVTFAMPLIGILGLLHGANDHNILAVSFSRKSKDISNHRISSTMPLIYLVYIFVAASTLGLWCWADQIALLVFLVISTLHFGKEEVSSQTIEKSAKHRFFRDGIVGFCRVIASGGLCIFMPLIFHHKEVISIFELLLQKSCVPDCTHYILNALEAIWISTFFVAVIASTRRKEIVSLARAKEATFASALLMFICLPPILAFAIYFSFYHSIENILETARNGSNLELFRDVVEHVKKSWVNTFLAFVGAPVIIYLIMDHASREQFLARSIFIGLASLTAPHVIVHSRFLSRVLFIFKFLFAAGTTRPVEFKSDRVIFQGHGGFDKTH